MEINDKFVVYPLQLYTLNLESEDYKFAYSYIEYLKSEISKSREKVFLDLDDIYCAILNTIKYYKK